MNVDDLKSLIREIVTKACTLKNKHTNEQNAPINYACIFSQNNREYKELLEIARRLGKVIKETPTGPLFHIQPIETNSGQLKLLKIRQPDKTRPERGDADFTVPDYQSFKEEYLSKKGFKLIERKEYCDCGNLLTTEEEFDLRICKECK